MSLQNRIQLDFTSLDEFMRFVEFIRGKEITQDKLKELTKEVNSSDKTLQDAINRNNPSSNDFISRGEK